MLHLRSYAHHLLDNEAIMEVIEAIYAPSSFKCVSAGGDFVLAGERRFQRMHDDLGGLTHKDNVHRPPPLVSVNFCVQEITGDNGPMRIVPGTQLDRGQWASSPKEPAEWRATRLFPLPVGTAIVRAKAARRKTAFSHQHAAGHREVRAVREARAFGGVRAGCARVAWREPELLQAGAVLALSRVRLHTLPQDAERQVLPQQEEHAP